MCRRCSFSPASSPVSACSPPTPQPRSPRSASSCSPTAPISLCSPGSCSASARAPSTPATAASWRSASGCCSWRSDCGWCCARRWGGCSVPSPHSSMGRGRSPRSPALSAPRPVTMVAAGWALAVVLLLRLALGSGDLLAGRLVDDLHGEAHLATVVEAQQLDPHLLALLDDHLHGLGPTLGQLRDVHQAVLGAEEVHESAELHDLDDLALVDLADLGLGRDAADTGERRLDRLALGGGDLDRAVILDVDLGARLGDDLADHRATRADHLADLVDRDLDGLDARRVLAELGAGAAERLGHLAEDVQAAGVGLLQRLAHDLLGDAGDLDVHLQRGDALLSAGHLEVHVAQVVLVAQNVGEHGEA